MRPVFDSVVRDKPDGGFVSINVGVLFAAWWCYREGTIELADLRLWFALHEAKARRCQMRKSRRPRYSVDELLTLTQQRKRSSVRASLRRLRELGLVTCRRCTMEFPKSHVDVCFSDADAFHQRFSLIQNRRRGVPVPRRLIRFVAAKSRRVIIATLLGHTMRLLYLRNGQCRADGNCKASWIAEVFGVDVRSVKEGRRRLIERGVLQPQETPQWYRNRYGWRGAVNLEWGTVDNLPARDDCLRKPPPQATSICSKPPPPRQNQYLSSRILNQQPACGANGASRKRTDKWHVRLSELTDREATQGLFERAVSSGVVGRSDRLNVFAAAQHALRVGTRNPAGLFAWLLRNRQWNYITQADEDAALRVLHDSRSVRGNAKTSELVRAADILEHCFAA